MQLRQCCVCVCVCVCACQYDMACKRKMPKSYAVLVSTLVGFVSEHYTKILQRTTPLHISSKRGQWQGLLLKHNTATVQRSSGLLVFEQHLTLSKHNTLV